MQLRHKRTCMLTSLTWLEGKGGTVETLGGVHFGVDPSNMLEHSVYAVPMPTPAPKATDAHRVTGLPGMINQKHQYTNSMMTFYLFFISNCTIMIR